CTPFFEKLSAINGPNAIPNPQKYGARMAMARYGLCYNEDGSDRTTGNTVCEGCKYHDRGSLNGQGRGQTKKLGVFGLGQCSSNTSCTANASQPTRSPNRA
ncbi:unnamed protein product, partial [Ectocarpus sp. 12 AP-2014]